MFSHSFYFSHKNKADLPLPLSHSGLLHSIVGSDLDTHIKIS